MPTRRKTTPAARYVIKPQIKQRETITLDLSKENLDALRSYGMLPALGGSSPEHIIAELIGAFVEKDVLPALKAKQEPKEQTHEAAPDGKQPRPKLVKTEGAA